MEEKLKIKTEIPRLYFIDALRGIAILGVIMIHTWSIFRQLGPHVASFIDWGARGVQLFFIISSFTIFFSIENRKDPNFKGYFIRRFFRIAPLFYIVMLISTFLIVGFNNTDWPLFFFKIFFIENFNPYWVNHGIIGVEWTIGVEMIFYAFVPFLFLKIKKLGSAFLVFFITFFIPLILYNTGIYPVSPEWNLYKAFSFISHFYIFILGIIIYFLFNKFQSLKETYQVKISNLCLFLLIFLLLLDIAGIENYSKILKGIFSIHLNYLLYFSLLFFASIKSFVRNVWVNPITIYIGKISFSAYLLHRMVNLFITSHFLKMNPYSLTILSFITIILISSISYFFIEKPFIKLGNSIAKKFNND